MNPTPISNHEKPNPKPQSNDPAAHVISPWQPQPHLRKFKQGSDPKKDNDPKQDGNHKKDGEIDVKSEPKADSNSVAQNDPKQVDNVNPIGAESGKSAPPVNV
ncbi:MAG: hypothetical protein Q9161_008324 [Pseudevernia consocians]